MRQASKPGQPDQEQVLLACEAGQRDQEQVQLAYEPGQPDQEQVKLAYEPGQPNARALRPEVPAAGPAHRWLSFPNPVNEVSARIVAAGVVVMCVLTIVFNLHWATAIIAYGFVARVLTGPRLSPLGQLSTRVLTPALPFRAKLVPGPPKRFAQAVGVAFSVSALGLTLVGAWGAAQVVLALLSAAAFLESALGLCLGCKAFAGLMQLGLVPPEVCESCNNIWARGKAGGVGSEPATPFTLGQ